jgi:hypothetical protein
MVSSEIADRCGEYVPNPGALKQPRRQFGPDVLTMREIYRHGSMTIRQISELLGGPETKARYHLEPLVGRGDLLLKHEGHTNRYALSPQTEPGYKRNDPLIDTYWALPGKLLTGEYPGFEWESEKRRLLARLRWLLDAGVTFFVDLPPENPGPSETYQSTLMNLASQYNQDIKYAAIPTSMRRLPGKKKTQSILDLMDQALEQGRTVYVHDSYSHCTEAILGCYFVRHGMKDVDALKELGAGPEGKLRGLEARTSAGTRSQIGA